MFYKILNDDLKKYGDYVELDQKDVKEKINIKFIDVNEDGSSNLDEDLQKELETMKQIATYNHKYSKITLYRTNKNNLLYIREKSCIKEEPTNLLKIYSKVKNDINDDFYKWLKNNNINEN